MKSDATKTQRYWSAYSQIDWGFTNQKIVYYRQRAPRCIIICLSMKKKIRPERSQDAAEDSVHIYATDFIRPSVTTDWAITRDGAASQNIELLLYLNLRNVVFLIFVVYVTILNFLFRFQIFSKPRWFIFQNVLGLYNRFIWRCFIMEQINYDISFWTIIHHSRLKLSDNL